MITFSCPKCGKGFQVPDSAVGQHGWCRGCGSIIRVPASSDASEADIVAIQLDPRVQALLRHMTEQIRVHRAQAKEAQAALNALRNSSGALATHERVLQKAEELSRNLQESRKHLDEDRRAGRDELRAVLHALRELFEEASQRTAHHAPGPLQEQTDTLRNELQHERSRHAETTERVGELERQCAAATQDSKNHQAEINRLEQRLDKAEERAAGLASRCGKLEEQTAGLRRERDEAQRLLEDRTTAADETEAVTARLQEKESVIQRLSEELRAALESKGELDSVCRLRLDEIALLSAEVSAITQSAEAEITELQAELLAEREAHVLAERMLADTQEEIRELRQMLDASHEAAVSKAALERELALLRDSLEKGERALNKRQAQLDESTAQLQQAQERSHALEAELARVSISHSAPREQGPEVQPQTAELEEPSRAASLQNSGPFPGPFVAPSELSDAEQGITLMPEVLDDDSDSREMLDTLMRFLGPEEAQE